MSYKLYMRLTLWLTLFCILHLRLVKSDWLYQNKVEAQICYNPNNNLGFCVPTKECGAYNFILRHNLKANLEFFRASECELQYDNVTPSVCCTSDIQFRKRKLGKNCKDRIIFPDELERVKKNSDNKGSTEVSTEKIIHIEPVDSITESQKTNISEETTVSTVISVTNNTSMTVTFPKPPYCGSITVTNKIYGGEDADLSEFSWMVILEYRNQTTGKLLLDCAGSLINDRYVLTAAHCVLGDILYTVGKLESVRIGEYNTDTDLDCNETVCNAPFQRILIESIIPHSNFSFKSYFGTRNQHDIALLRLKKSVKFNTSLQPICLPNVGDLRELDESTKFVVAGWGHNGTMVRTAIKQKLELPLIKHEKCREIFGKKFYLANEQLCAGGRFREDSCNGDSGGPLMRINKDFWVLEGIVSFGLKCGLEQPGIYTNIRNYIDWINENVNS